MFTASLRSRRAEPPAPQDGASSARLSARFVLPGVEVDPEEFEARWNAATKAGARVVSTDLYLATGLRFGAPAAWAILWDLYRPHVLSAARAAAGGDPADAEHAAEAAADAFYRDLYEHRDDAGWPGSFARYDGRETLLEHVCAEAARRFGRGTVPPAMDVARLIESHRIQSNGHGTRPERHILNLPALLVLVFCIVIVPVVFTLLSQPASDVASVRRGIIADYVRDGLFDKAVEELATDPPAGQDQLRPLWPNMRNERLMRLRNAQAPLRPLRLVEPRGKIDDTRPLVRFAAHPQIDDVMVRIVAEENGKPLFERVVPKGTTSIRPEHDLPRGRLYGVEIRSLGPIAAADRVSFHVLSETERSTIEFEIQQHVDAFGDRAVFAFVAAHVYRAHDCLRASIEAFRLLASEHPESTYPVEEEALLLAELGLIPEALDKVQTLFPDGARDP